MIDGDHLAEASGEAARLDGERVAGAPSPSLSGSSGRGRLGRSADVHRRRRPACRASARRRARHRDLDAEDEVHALLLRLHVLRRELGLGRDLAHHAGKRAARIASTLIVARCPTRTRPMSVSGTKARSHRSCASSSVRSARRDSRSRRPRGSCGARRRRWAPRSSPRPAARARWSMRGFGLRDSGCAAAGDRVRAAAPRAAAARARAPRAPRRAPPPPRARAGPPTPGRGARARSPRWPPRPRRPAARGRLPARRRAPCRRDPPSAGSRAPSTRAWPGRCEDPRAPARSPAGASRPAGRPGCASARATCSSASRISSRARARHEVAQLRVGCDHRAPPRVAARRAAPRHRAERGCGRAGRVSPSRTVSSAMRPMIFALTSTWMPSIVPERRSAGRRH